jgi:hypothetical protein
MVACLKDGIQQRKMKPEDSSIYLYCTEIPKTPALSSAEVTLPELHIASNHNYAIVHLRFGSIFGNNE